MTHFGGVGTMEAIWTAVPMVGMALEGDQGQYSAVIFALIINCIIIAFLLRF